MLTPTHRNTHILMVCICSGVTGTGHTEVWKQKDIQPHSLQVSRFHWLTWWRPKASNHRVNVRCVSVRVEYVCGQARHCMCVCVASWPHTRFGWTIIICTLNSWKTVQKWALVLQLLSFFNLAHEGQHQKCVTCVCTCVSVVVCSNSHPSVWDTQHGLNLSIITPTRRKLNLLITMAQQTHRDPSTDHASCNCASVQMHVCTNK